MILPLRERLQLPWFSELKGAAEASLSYQLRKTAALLDVAECELDDQSLRPEFVPTDRLSFAVDALLNNVPILIEYYHVWVVRSRIGSVQESSGKYQQVFKDDNFEARLSDVMKSNGIGELSCEYSEGERAEYIELCRKDFKRAYHFLWVGRFHELHALNNYIKHNAAPMGYAPKLAFNSVRISVPFLSVERPFREGVGNSVLRRLFDNEVTNEVARSSIPAGYFNDIIRTRFRHFGFVGSTQLFEINGVEYTKSANAVGVTVESIVELVQDLIVQVCKSCLEADDGNQTLQAEWGRILNLATRRKPATIEALMPV